MGTTSDKLTYLSATKDKLKTAINAMGGEIDDDTFRSYSSILNDLVLQAINGEINLYDEYPKKQSTGTMFSMEGTEPGKAIVELNSTELSQDGTPTSLNPLPINVTKGNNIIYVCGKNLVNLTEALKTAVASCSLEDETANSMTLKGTNAWGNSSITIANNFKNQDMYIKSSFESSLGRKIGITIYGTDVFDYVTADLTNIESGTYDITADEKASVGFTFNTGNYKYLVIRFWNNDTGTALGSSVNLYITEVCLNKGLNEINYEAYDGDKYTINLGSNLFDKDTATYDDTHFKNDSGTVSSSSTSGYTTSYIEVKPNTSYTIDGVSITRIYRYDSSKGWISRNTTNISLPYTFTTPNNCYYIQFQYTKATYDATKVIIQEGITCSYKPYGTSDIEYCKIGNYSDKIKYSAGNYYIEKHVDKIDSYNGETINTDYISTTGALDTGATVYYGLENSVDVLISDTTLISNLDNFINNIKSFKGETNITQLNYMLPFTIDMSTLKKLDV